MTSEDLDALARIADDALGRFDGRSPDSLSIDERMDIIASGFACCAGVAGDMAGEEINTAMLLVLRDMAKDWVSAIDNIITSVAIAAQQTEEAE